MFCPRCGKQLIEIERKDNSPQIDWGSASTEEIDAYLEAVKDYQPCKREEYECEGGCFQKDFPLYFHHPFQGINAAPGDSWSLSWIE